MNDPELAAEIGESRSWLFVPGSRPERFDKAAMSGADQIILDLEDAVDAVLKDDARDAVVGWLRSGRRAWVRINGVDTDWWDDDVAALVGSGPGLRGVVVPKADGHAVGLAAERTGGSLPLVALVENARGVRDVHATAAHPDVVALAFGSVDYALDTGATADSAMDFARHTLVVAGRAAGITGLIDGISLDLADAGAVHHAMAPTASELAWATRVVTTAAGLPPERSGAFRVDGRMVDRPVLLHAHHLIARSERPL